MLLYKRIKLEQNKIKSKDQLSVEMIIGVEIESWGNLSYLID